MTMSVSKLENREPVTTNIQRVPPSPAELTATANAIRARRGQQPLGAEMNDVLRSIGARPPEPYQLARDLCYGAGLPNAALPIFQKMFERIEALEDAVRFLKQRGLPAEAEIR